MTDRPESEKKHLFTKSNYLLDLEYLIGLEKVAPHRDAIRFMTDLSILFLKQAPLEIQALDKTLPKNDKKAVAAANSRLKGVCAGIGALYMTDLCRQIEKSIGDKDGGLTRLLVEQLKDAFLVTRDQVQAYTAQVKNP
ncbi:MAG: Hpt domain-containing protein [Chitinophagaceae bacterium]|nr:Hpt domain-containing protein [Oligoflexus sp.]